MDHREFPLDRFEEGERVFVWKRHQFSNGDAVHGEWGVKRGKFVLLSNNLRVYHDSGAAFMSEEEFSVFDVMDV